VATAGQTIYCIANFTATPNLASTYDGTFDVKANYCAAGLNSLFNYSCPADSSFSYTGHITVQASRFSLSKTMTTTLTLTNSQNSAIPAHFDQMINFSASSYSPYVNSNLGNIRFYYGDKELYSWCESGCSSSASSNSIFWIRLPQAIPPNTIMPIEMYILPISVGYSGKHAGEAPQWTCPNPSNTAGCSTYGKYDNGVSVFKFYDNFAGTSLNTNKWNVYGTISYTINNGLTVSSYGSTLAGIYSVDTSAISTGQTMDFYGTPYQSGSTYTNTGFFNHSASVGAFIQGYNGNIFLQVQDAGGNSATMATSSSYAVFSINFISTSETAITAQMNYGSLYSQTNSGTFSYSSFPIAAAFTNSQTLSPIQYVQWLRTRIYPPNGVMPKVSFGTLAPA